MMGLNRRSFLSVFAGGAALATAGKRARAEHVTIPSSSAVPSTVYVWRYRIDPNAPRLKPPIDIFDIVDQRLGYPHPEFYGKGRDMLLGRPDLDQANHAYQSAEFALQKGWSDEVVTAAFLHDLGKGICYEKHTWFSAEMMKPYVSEKVYWLARMHFDSLKARSCAHTL